MDEREGPKLSQKGVSSIATHLQTHNKMKVASDLGGEGPRRESTDFATVEAQTWEACAPGSAQSLTQCDLEAQFPWNSFFSSL